MTANALAQQPVADSLAAVHTSTAEPSARTSQASQQADAARRFVTGSVITPLFITPLITTPPTPSCGCAEVLSHPVVYHTPFVALASCTLLPGLREIPHPVIYLFKPKTSSPGCCFLCSIRYTHLQNALEVPAELLADGLVQGHFPRFLVLCLDIECPPPIKNIRCEELIHGETWLLLCFCHPIAACSTSSKNANHSKTRHLLLIGQGCTTIFLSSEARNLLRQKKKNCFFC